MLLALLPWAHWPYGLERLERPGAPVWAVWRGLALGEKQWLCTAQGVLGGS